MEESGQFPSLAALPSGEEVHSTDSIGGGVGLRGGLDTVRNRKISAPTRNRTPMVQLVLYCDCLLITSVGSPVLSVEDKAS
jgi:hypothetical protein